MLSNCWFAILIVFYPFKCVFLSYSALNFLIHHRIKIFLLPFCQTQTSKLLNDSNSTFYTLKICLQSYQCFKSHTYSAVYLEVILTSLKRVMIFPFLTSQMNAPLRDVAPAMQFRSPSKDTETERSSALTGASLTRYCTTLYRRSQGKFLCMVMYLHCALVEFIYAFPRSSCLQRFHIHLFVCTVSLHMWVCWRTTWSPRQRVDHSLITRGGVNSC